MPLGTELNAVAALAACALVAALIAYETVRFGDRARVRMEA